MRKALRGATEARMGHKDCVKKYLIVSRNIIVILKMQTKLLGVLLFVKYG